MIDLTFITGRISHDDLSTLRNEDLDGQVCSLKEDMLQVEYPAFLLLDVGWYPSFDPDGFFQVRVLKNYDWSEPLYLSRADSVPLLIKELVAAQDEIGRVTAEIKC
ncbi:hypothetical protein NTD84_01205 [Pseudomonas sp. 14P_8.1_Bac3]|jgi:hypothetical protein|uniref:hypothetical protein n=1 Tax=Pseudomonas sp. 14P_8.1_Bac3 TaxID=2971621 RepID=UPI0021CA4D72|nr:hypothetical protein [Pseudomonas sp. 14P_8.1_Bac3]MCU1758341.1 hypothetical protein [Pseudomonas sp. 14P_8.1_Bac3]